ncbi:hypothetical protein V5O48_000789 [Marasmius crinis-equi]|uniref:F-box domain-containing protein n=1 Tax=Marasmius crinis-equi TaxID=585013 RepID=A0ABR3G047_9AGAR
MDTDATIFCENCERKLPIGRDAPRHTPISGAHLHSEHVPTESEISETAKIIEDEERLLDEYDKAIGQLLQKMDRLQEERGALAKRIGDRRSSISAIRKLPVELWSEIFSYHCNDPCSLTICDARQPKAPTNDLSKVCTRWKTMVVGLPHLWSSIRFHFFEHAQRSFQGPHGSILQKYLQNSREHPLDVTLEHRDRCYHRLPDDEVAGLSLLKTLFNHLPRCSVLQLNLEPVLLHSIDLPTNQWFPFLRSFHEKLSLASPGPGSESNPLDRLRDIILSNAPNLVHVTTMQLFDTWIPGPCPHLVSIEADRTSFPSSLLRLLSKTPSLREFTADKTKLDPGPYLTMPLTLSHLHKITLFHDEVDSSSTAFSVFLDSLTLPALEDAKFGVFGSHGVQIPSGWISLIPGILHRSQCLLWSLDLTLCNMDMNVTEICGTLRSCPTLLDLRILIYPHDGSMRDVPSSNQLLLDLASPSSGGFLPKLKTLIIEEDLSTLTASVVEAVLTVAERRSPHRAPLYGLASLAEIGFRSCTGGLAYVAHPGNAEGNLDDWCATVEARIEALEEDEMICEID